jgi:hypothetical protein
MHGPPIMLRAVVVCKQAGCLSRQHPARPQALHSLGEHWPFLSVKPALQEAHVVAELAAHAAQLAAVQAAAKVTGASRSSVGE